MHTAVKFLTRICGVLLYRRIDIIKGLEKYSQGKIKLLVDLELLDLPEVNKYLIETCEKFDVKCSLPQTTTCLLDKVCGCIKF